MSSTGLCVRINQQTKESIVAGATGLEPATSCVTGSRSNQLNYAPANRLPMTSASYAVLLGPARPFE
jgi:hypothetical protein